MDDVLAAVHRETASWCSGLRVALLTPDVRTRDVRTQCRVTCAEHPGATCVQQWTLRLARVGADPLDVLLIRADAA